MGPFVSGNLSKWHCFIIRTLTSLEGKNDFVTNTVNSQLPTTEKKSHAVHKRQTIPRSQRVATKTPSSSCLDARGTMAINHMGNHKMGAEQEENQLPGNCVRILHGILLALRDNVKLMLTGLQHGKGTQMGHLYCQS